MTPAQRAGPEAWTRRGILRVPYRRALAECPGCAPAPSSHDQHFVKSLSRTALQVALQRPREGRL
jgi:hypothetical protein